VELSERARGNVGNARERRKLDAASEITDARASGGRRSEEERFDERLRALRIALSTERCRRRAAEEGKDLASTELARMAGTLMIARGQVHELESRLAASGEATGAESTIHPEVPRGRARRQANRGGRVVAGIAALASLAIAGAFVAGDDSRGGAGTGPGGDRGVLDTERTPAAERSVATIPPRYLSMYRAAGRTYGLDWAMLAAVGMTESNHGRSSDAGVRAGRNARGAIGPAQFLHATWERFGVDANANGIRSPYEPADAIAAMASYLRSEGAPKDWGSALLAYNPDRTYVERILRRAAAIRAQTAR
jgi:membrane-bound lytic murein transglycosylase B